MSDDMATWLRKQLDAIEAAALAATFEQTHPAGNRWIWGEVGQVDSPVVRGGYLRGNGGLSSDVSLVTVERYAAADANMAFPAQALHGATKVHAEVAEHIVLHDPASVLADIAAKRDILDELDHMERNEIGWDGIEDLMRRMIAVGYAHRPGYKEAWRP